MNAQRRPHAPRRSQRGVFAILYAVLLLPLLGFFGMALDLAMMFARTHELRAIADGGALAAARALDGTLAGVTAAKENAKAAAEENLFGFPNPISAVWDVGALSFSADVDGPWIPANEVTASQAARLFYAKVDTDLLSDGHGRVNLIFMGVLGAAAQQNRTAMAIAGRGQSTITPLAVCALQKDKKGHRKNLPAANAAELLEFGFRRGISYNLLNLNPLGHTPKNYLVNPVDFGALSHASHLTDAAVRPFVCTGTMPAPLLQEGSQLHVRETFPPALITELNSRFADYPAGTTCTKVVAPPDTKIYDFRGWWMSPKPASAPGSAAMRTIGPALVTVGEAEEDVSGINKEHYGPLWSFSKPLRIDIDTGTIGAPFTHSDWSVLYRVAPPGSAPAKTYSHAYTPYESKSLYRLSPTPYTGLARRRILNVPLLDCSVPGARATMLGIGRFFMTTKATSDAVHAEFGGLVEYGSLAASAVLYR